MDYYAGTQAKLYIGGIWVDDIVSVQYQVSTQHSPIYGYASDRFDAIATGTSIVQGTFTIAFREVGYLVSILKQLEYVTDTRNMKRRLASIKAASKRAAQKDTDSILNRQSAASDNQGNASVPHSPQVSMNLSRSDGDVIVGNTRIEDLLDPNGANFEQVVDELERRIWGSKGGGRTGVPRVDGVGWYDQPLFDIVITYGETKAGRRFTTESINGVKIIGTGKLIEATGNPILEQYTFIARDINRSVDFPSDAELRMPTVAQELREEASSAISSDELDEITPSEMVTLVLKFQHSPVVDPGINPYERVSSLLTPKVLSLDGVLKEKGITEFADAAREEYVQKVFAAIGSSDTPITVHVSYYTDSSSFGTMLGSETIEVRNGRAMRTESSAGAEQLKSTFIKA